jgi:hypothetical protein
MMDRCLAWTHHVCYLFQLEQSHLGLHMYGVAHITCTVQIDFSSTLLHMCGSVLCIVKCKTPGLFTEGQRGGCGKALIAA